MSPNIPDPIAELQRFLLDPRIQCNADHRVQIEQLVATGKVLRADSPESHVCAYLLIYDDDSSKMFLGHHIKSGHWLVIGGHIDPGEHIIEGGRREAKEEISYDWHFPAWPVLLTWTNIGERPYPCRFHIDVWLPLPLSPAAIDDESVCDEFDQWGWYTLPQARKLVTDPANLLALDWLEEKWRRDDRLLLGFSNQ